MTALRFTALFLLSSCLVGCKSSSDDGAGLRIRSDTLTAEVAAALFAKNDDFDALRAKLVEALSLNPDNQNARFFLALTEVLAFTKQNLSQGPGPLAGKLGDMLARGGITLVDPTANFWDWRFQEELHGQGDIKDSIPTLTEVEQFITQDLIPKLEAALRGLDSVFKSFNYKIEIESGLIYGQTGGQPQPLWIDFGDVSMLKANLRLLLAGLRTLIAYEWDSVNLNDFDRIDFPRRDSLDWIEKNYPILGTIKIQQRLLDARQDVMVAWLNYRAASEHIRSESQEQSDSGLLTLGRGNLDPVVRDRFLESEAAFRVWAQEIVDHFVIDTALTITKKPGGTPLPPEEQVAINFLRFWIGVDLRAALFKTVLDPFEGRRTLGVTSLAGLTPDMYQYGGVLSKVEGVAPGPGDLQLSGGAFPRYAMSISSLPANPNILLDGKFDDWTSSNSVQIGAAPKTGATPIGTVDQGRIYAAFDAKIKTLYLRIDANAARYLKQAGDYYLASLRSGPGSAAWAGERFGTGKGWFGTGIFGTPFMATSAEGIEIGVPVPGMPQAGTWVEVEYEIQVRNSTNEISTKRSGMFVRIK